MPGKKVDFPGDLKRRFYNYQKWTDTITSYLAFTVDSENIDRLQSSARRVLGPSNVPSDFKSWIESDILNIGKALEDLHDAVGELGLEGLSRTIDLWHRRMVGCLKTEWYSPVIVVGPAPVADVVLPADVFLKKFATDPLKATAATRRPVDVAADEADIIAFLQQAARQPGISLKPFVDDPYLRVCLEKIIDSIETSGKSLVLSGAPTIMAYACRLLRIPADVLWHYHPQRVARHGDDEPLSLVQRVVIRDGEQFEVKPFRSFDLRRPHRQSIIINLAAGMDVAGVQARGSDRVIFRQRRPSTNDWDLHQVVIKCSAGTIGKPSSWQLAEWPALPLIGSVEAVSKDQRNSMTFTVAGDHVLGLLSDSSEGDYGKFVWTGLQALEDPGWDDNARDILADEVKHQFDFLKDCAQIYVEFSGVPKDPSLMMDICKGRVSCIGINSTELLQLTSQGTKENNPVWVWPNPALQPESLLARYHRAIRLADYMETDVLVHGNECSFYVTRRHERRRLERIVSALLTAKLAVVANLLHRSGKTSAVEQPSLAEKGFMALLQFACDFARSNSNMDLFHQLMTNGYLCARDDSEFSVAVVPVLWPEEVQQVNPTGAGDTIAGVAAALMPG